MSDDSKDRSGTITAAIIAALATILAALIGYCATLPKSSETSATNKSSNNQTPVTTPQPAPSNPPATTNSEDKEQATSTPASELYEAAADVGEGKSYTDKETGLVFAVDEITSGLFKGHITGVLCRYTLPDGTKARMLRRKVGDRTDFQYQGRKFFMVIEDIDYDQKIARIRIRETR